MYTFISVIKPVEQHTQTHSVKHKKKKKKEITLTTNSKHAILFATLKRWLGSRVVSVLDSGAKAARVQIAAATLSGNSLRPTAHTHCASVHQAAKLVAALLRVVGVTAGLAEW